MIVYRGMIPELGRPRERIMSLRPTWTTYSKTLFKEKRSDDGRKEGRYIKNIQIICGYIYPCPKLFFKMESFYPKKK